MPDTTVYDFPYPAPTDLVRNGPQDFEDLAEKVEETLLAFPTYGEAVHSYGTVTTNTNIDLELGPVQVLTLGGNVTLTVTGDPTASGVARSVLLVLIMDGTSRTVTWAGVDTWYGEEDPTGWDINTEVAVTFVATSTAVRAFVVPEAV
jgi:hypothetical protein